jgi:hypothetical protein
MKEKEDKKVIEAYGFIEFLKLVQAGVQEGYELDFMTNEGFPQQMGTYYRGTLLLQKEEVKVQKATKKEKAESKEVKETKEVKAAEVSDA